VVRGIVFDLDGTLVDSLADIAASVDLVLRSHGRVEHGAAAYRDFIGRGIGVLVRRAWGVADDATGPEIDALVEEVRTVYDEHCLDRTQPYDGIPALLAEIRRRGIAISVVSNKPDAMTQRVVAHLFDAATFSTVTGERSGLPRKPDPTQLIRATSFMGVDPSRCLMVGDSPVDIEAGHRVPMRTVAVTWGLGRIADLRAAAPSHLAHRPVDLLAALG
jgi:phosphoglycolate phosphatase